MHDSRINNTIDQKEEQEQVDKRGTTIVEVTTQSNRKMKGQNWTLDNKVCVELYNHWRGNVIKQGMIRAVR